MRITSYLPIFFLRPPSEVQLVSHLAVIILRTLHYTHIITHITQLCSHPTVITLHVRENQLSQSNSLTLGGPAG